MKRKTVQQAGIYFFLSIVVVGTLFPLFWALMSSLRADIEFFEYVNPFSIHTLIPVEFTFDAYITVFQDFGFLQPIINTIIITLIAIIAGSIINSVAAYGFAVFDFKGKSILFSLFLLSFMIPFESIALPLYSLVDDLGWVDTYAGIIIPGLADGLVLFLFTQFFRDLPKSMFEAARIDGASWLTIFFRIAMPLSIPVFVTAGLMIFMGQWNSYLWPLVVGRGEDVRMIQIALGAFQQERTTLWSALYAASMISALIPLFLFLPFQKFYVQGITSSGIKG